ncbi:hypothetical protein [Aurantimonas sp. Leaf443]|uniref:hypothetical protein n=1 Tax=Aurantimonas sp. Leaf443 TaxID=1736378 RepID=UPI0006FD57C0|nr:hypothetical protein [Aurantimonas sp. Leaf443]KQT84097.1 hypothetical protein ASG48_12080 [Aurantimonas sp. Leaf443]
MQDRHNPFYNPLWVRLLILAVCLSLVGFEVWNGSDPLWLGLAVAVTAYAVWSFFIAFDPKDKAEK